MSKEFFVFRLNKIKVVNNREWGPGEIKLLSFITGADVGLPILDDLQRTDDPDEKKRIIKTATQLALSSKVLMQVDHIKDNHILFFGDTGYALYTGDKIPISFNWSVLAFEIDEDVNRLGQRIDNIVNLPGFDQFTSNILNLVGVTANPAAAAGVAISKFVFGLVADTMMVKKDDQVGVTYQSFNKFEHYPHGERKRDDVPDLSNNLRIDYSIFGTTY